MSILKGAPQTVNYLSFDGVNDYINFEDYFRFDDAFSMTFDIEIPTNQSFVLFSKGDDNNTQREFAILMNTNLNTIRVLIFDGEFAQRYDKTFTYNFPLNQRFEFEFDWDGTYTGSSSMTAFVDGNSLNTQSFNSGGSPIFINRSEDGIFGANYQASGSFFEGKLYSMTYSYQNSLVSLYNLYEGSGTTLGDSSGNNDGTIVGATWVSPAIQNIYYGTNEVSRVYLGESLVYGEPLSFELGTVTYDNVSFSVESQDNNPQGLTFNNDGTKMFIVGIITDSVYEYTLSTPFNIGTANYNNVSFSVSSQDENPRGLVFNNDGSKMFIVGADSQSVYQYTLSTPFNVGTASYDNVGINVSSQASFPEDLTFNNDGSKMFVVGRDSQNVYEYTLSTPFNIGTASYNNVSFSVASEDNNSRGLTFNNDGSKMFIVGRDSQRVYQYTLSTPFNVATASYDNVSFDLLSQSSSSQGLVFNNDGSKMFIVGNFTNTVYQYTNDF